MKRILFAAVAAIAITTAAGANPFDATYGNTVTQTFPNGMKVLVYINADGSWEQHIGTTVQKGTYAWKDATNVCFTQTDPAPADAAKAVSCIVIKDTHKVGDSWDDPMPDGKTAVHMSITAGR